MNLKILTFNVRGLNDKASLAMLQHYVRAVPALDVLLIQEHKLRRDAAVTLGTRLWQQAGVWTREDSPGYNHDGSDDGAGCGGVATFVGDMHN